jgi:hypothetical protein
VSKEDQNEAPSQHTNDRPVERQQWKQPKLTHIRAGEAEFNPGPTGDTEGTS